MPRPVDRSLQGGLARRGAADAGQQAEAVRHALHELRRRENARPCGSQLNCQWQAVEQAHHLQHRAAVVLVEHEVPAVCCCPGGEEFDGVGGPRERLQRRQHFAADVQALAAGDQKGRLFGSIQPKPERGRSVLDDLLEVVQDQEAAAARGDGVAQLHCGVALKQRHVEPHCHRVEHAFEAARFAEVAEVNASRPVAAPDAAISPHQPGLADAPRAGHGD